MSIVNIATVFYLSKSHSVKYKHMMITNGKCFSSTTFFVKTNRSLLPQMFWQSMAYKFESKKLEIFWKMILLVTKILSTRKSSYLHCLVNMGCAQKVH